MSNIFMQYADKVTPKKILRGLISPWFLAPAILAGVALLDEPKLFGIIAFAADAFAGTFKYIVFATVLIAYLKAAAAESLIAGAFKGKEGRMVVLATLCGIIVPFCSCEVIPFIAGLLALGVPLAPIMSFWLAAPLVDPATLLITASALGWEFAITRTLLSVGVGLLGGFATVYMVKYRLLPTAFDRKISKACAAACGTKPPQTVAWKFWHSAHRRLIFKDTFSFNFFFLTKWLILAYVLEALLISYVPAELIVSFVGGEGIMPIIIATVVGAPAYLNTYVAPPMIAGFVQQGMQEGAAMAFMIAGPITSIPAMAAVWPLVKRSVFMAYIGLGISGAILSGIAYQYL